MLVERGLPGGLTLNGSRQRSSSPPVGSHSSRMLWNKSRPARDGAHRWRRSASSDGWDDPEASLENVGPRAGRTCRHKWLSKRPAKGARTQCRVVERRRMVPLSPAPNGERIDKGRHLRHRSIGIPLRGGRGRLWLSIHPDVGRLRLGVAKSGVRLWSRLG